MKPNLKIGSFLMAVVMIFSMLAVAGCTPISLSKEWSYKTSDNELAIGVYIYSLDTAYQQAKTYASELEDYDESSDAWLEMEITDDDGDKAVAKDWIKSEAKKMCLTYLVLEEQLVKENVEISTDDMASAEDQAETYWNVGQYADYGYVMPMSDDLEPYGISLDSFSYCSTEFSVKYQALFDALYDEGGSKEVSDSDLKDYFVENYTDYSYFTVNLYTASTDEAGTSTNIAFSDEEAKKVTDEIDGYAKELNNGKSFDDIVEKYMDANEVTTDPSTSTIENLEDTSLGDDVKEALEGLDNNKATTLQVGDGDTAVYYIIYKRDIKDSADNYIKDGTNHANVLGAMKGEEFADYIEGLTESLEYEENTDAINKYDPKMFFVAVEPTTTAEEETTTAE